MSDKKDPFNQNSKQVVKCDRANKPKTLGRLFWHQNWQLARCVERCVVLLPCPTSRRVYPPTRPVSLIQNGGNYERQIDNTRKKHGYSIYDVITLLPLHHLILQSKIAAWTLPTAASRLTFTIHEKEVQDGLSYLLKGSKACETHARDSQKKLSRYAFSRVAIFVGRSPA